MCQLAGTCHGCEPGACREGNMSEDHVGALRRSLAKLIEQRRATAKRDGMSDRNEGFAERVVAIQAAIDATNKAIREEEDLLDDEDQQDDESGQDADQESDPA